MQCPSCAAQNPAENRFCGSCGQAMSSLSQMVTASHVGSGQAVAVGVGRLASSNVGFAGGFTPGAMLADRYRIIGLLGRGGMGEVYRADDLKLGQAVALKFLPAELSDDALRRERFFAEVRITRELSHPNICRVYDIAEVDAAQPARAISPGYAADRRAADPARPALHFLSMEFIDGEDLDSLLKRIGYLSNEKTIDIARQLVAGLGAAHDRGVLHRDLKPANIMIDGHGRVRITDFGLAVIASDEPATDVSGTPAYMAPEQLAGRGASVQSDLYAFGLVLYEITCGKKAFTARTIAELREQKELQTPTPPSGVRQGIDPVLDRLIMQCLERDPRSRPSSTAQVAAALPGGDPLAAAIAAGETPSPEMVAAAAVAGELTGLAGLACFAATLLVLGLIVSISPRTTVAGLVALEKGPEVLTDRARAIARALGYADRVDEEKVGFGIDIDDLQLIEQRDKSAGRWTTLRTNQPPAVLFWYRQNPQASALAGASVVSLFGGAEGDPPPGSLSIDVDPAGHLIGFTAIPPRKDPSESGRQADWAAMFSEAGLTMSQFTATKSAIAPPVYADTRAAWEGVYPAHADLPLRIEAAATSGRPVYFEMFGPSAAERFEMPRTPIFFRIFDSAVIRRGSVLVLALIAAAALLARRNLRLGRGDRRGAFRLSAYVGGSVLIAAVLKQGLLGLAAGTLTSAVIAIVVYITYVGLEPHVRRAWPETIIGWSRLLSGRFRDPLVGRDIIVGMLAGCVVSLILHLRTLTSAWFGLPVPRPFTVSISFLLGGRYALSEIVAAQVFNGWLMMAVLLMLFLLNALLRRRWLAAAATVLVGAGAQPFIPPGGDPIFTAVCRLLIAAIMVTTMIRFGLLAAIVARVVLQFTMMPLTFDPSVTYSESSFLLIAALIALAVYGFRTALAGRPVLGAKFLEHEPARS